MEEKKEQIQPHDAGRFFTVLGKFWFIIVIAYAIVILLFFVIMLILSWENHYHIVGHVPVLRWTGDKWIYDVETVKYVLLRSTEVLK